MKRRTHVQTQDPEQVAWKGIISRPNREGVLGLTTIAYHNAERAAKKKKA